MLSRLSRGALSYDKVRRGRVCRVTAVMARCVLLGSDMVRRLRWARWGQSGLGGCVKMCCCKVGSA